MGVVDLPESAMHLSVEVARACVLRLCSDRVVAGESVDLELALGRVLSEDLFVPHDLPPFANSAMDGFALRAADLPLQGERRFRISGTVLAGAPSAPACAAGECVRITTGAAMPKAADTVVIKENVREEGDYIVVPAGQRARGNVRPAGEDYRSGDIALCAGDRLTPARLGVLAACGHAVARVARLPRVALFVTGDELVPPGQLLGFSQIHDSNRLTLGSMLRVLGIEPEPLAHLRDDPDALRVALSEAAQRCDVVISSGGVSAGEADHLPAVITELGCVHFWKVRMKPGMPVLCGDVGGALMFALPGNPVSALATFQVLVQPALLALQGASDCGLVLGKAQLSTAVKKNHDRTEFLRARIQCSDLGSLQATPLVGQGSGMLRAVANANGWIVIPEDTHELATGSLVDVMPLAGAFSLQ